MLFAPRATTVAVMLVVAVPMVAPAASAQMSARSPAPPSAAAGTVAGLRWAAPARLAEPRPMLIRGLAYPPEAARQAMVRPHPGFATAAALLPPVASRVDAPIRELVRVQMSKMRRGRTLMIIGGAAFIGGGILGGAEGALVALGGVGIGAYGLILFLDDSTPR